MQKVNNFSQCFFRFILTGNVSKGFASLCFHIDLCITLAKGHGISSAHLLLQGFGKQLSYSNKQQNWETNTDQQIQQRRHWLLDLLAIDDIRSFQFVHQIRVTHVSGNIDIPVFLILQNVLNLLILNLYLLNLTFIELIHEGTVIDLTLGAAKQTWEQESIEQHKNQQRNDVIINHRLFCFWIFYIVHMSSHSFSPKHFLCIDVS